MKRLLPYGPLLLLAALLLCPADALAGAREGLDIWWGHVFPALLPTFISVKLSQLLGLLGSGTAHPRRQLAAVVGFSLVSGAPNGAKLLHALVESGAVSSEKGGRLLPLINCVSPAFMLSIIASELLKNKALFLPMAGAFYGCVLSLTGVQLLSRKEKNAPPSAAPIKALPFSSALSAAIESSMLDMLRIGGCILFTCTLLSLLRPLIPQERVFAALAACMEVTTGASAIAALSLPMRLKTSLLLGAALFGGLSFALQTLCCYPEVKLLPYLVRKLLLGLLAGSVCYLILPLFPTVTAAFASRQQVISRSLSLCALFLSCALSSAFIGVLSLMVSGKRNG